MTHTRGAAQNDESNFSSKLGILSADAQLRGSVPFGTVDGLLFNTVAPQAMTEVDGETFIGGANPTYGVHRVWQRYGQRKTPASRSMPRFDAKRPLQLPAHACGCGSLLDTASRMI